MASDAKFSVNADPFANAGFDATNAQVLTLQLEASPGLDILSVTYSVVAFSKGAPTLTFSATSPQPPTSAITVTMPASGGHTYLIAATITRSDGVDIKVRAIAIRFGPDLRKMAASETTEYDVQFGWTDAFNAALVSLVDAGFANRSQPGVAGRQTNNSDTLTTIGALILKLGTAGLPTVGRTLELEALLSTTDITNATRLDFFNLTTSQIVGSSLGSVLLTPERKILDVTAQVGSTLTDDAINIIVVRLAQTSTDVAELAVCDVAQINADYP